MILIFNGLLSFFPRIWAEVGDDAGGSVWWWRHRSIIVVVVFRRRTVFENRNLKFERS